uniref:FBD domain-containing protein n=1 Tax=Solanum lycopersicum TaxID=4081 RepID=A0A3Q7ITJ5_SOLLC
MWISDSTIYISNPLEAENPLFLNNLQTLFLHYSPFVEEIIRRIPNLKKLNIVDDSENLKQLILTHTYIPWEVVKLLANLPNHEVLKGYHAFDRTYWKLDEDIVCHNLKYLLLNGFYYLKRWEAEPANFPMLEQLILDNISAMKEIPESIEEIITLKFIRIIWCSSGVETSARKIQEEHESLGNYELQLQITPKIC